MKAFPENKPRFTAHVRSGEKEQASLNPTMTLPSKATNKPMNIAFVILSLRNKGDRSATQRGAVVTNTTELATEVYSREVIQEAKWQARRKPDKMIKIQSFPPILRISDRVFQIANGAMNKAAKVIR